MDQASEFEGIIEKIIGLNREEIQAVTLSNDITSKATWTIKLYGAIEEWKMVLERVLDIDNRIFQQIFFNRPTPSKNILLKRVNKYRDPVVSIELTRKVKSPPSWEVKCLGCVGEEDKVLDICFQVNQIMKTHKFGG